MSHEQSINRRTLLTASGIAATSGLTALAGCTETSTEPPPRKSNVIAEVKLMNDGSTLQIDPYSKSDRWVKTRRDLAVDTSPEQSNQIDSTELTAIPAVLTALSPIGVAQAAKGRGATGRGSGDYSSAPRTANGRAWFWGGAYATGWYNDHDDEVDQYPVDIATLGVGYVGSDAQFKEQDPGPGPISWDDTYNVPTGEEIKTSLQGLRPGWYRVGANIIMAQGPDKGTDLGWECLDLRVEEAVNGKEITERWKVSPRI